MTHLSHQNTPMVDRVILRPVHLNHLPRDADDGVLRTIIPRNLSLTFAQMDLQELPLNESFSSNEENQEQNISRAM